jgi:flagellar hook-associated protein 2
MGSITTGVGLISGIDIAALIDSIITIESQGKFRLQERVGVLQSQQTALLDVNARLLSFKSSAQAFRTNNIFSSVLATSANEDVLTATATTDAQPGTYNFIVKQLVSTSQLMSTGYASEDANPLGLDSISFEFGNGRLAQDRALEDLNGGNGVDRGEIVITDGAANTATIDLTDVTSVNEVLDRINSDATIDVTATVEGDHFVITDNTGGPAVTIANGVGDTTATDLGIEGTSVGPVLTGSSVFALGLNTSLSSLNDGNGVLVRDNVADLRITSRNGTAFDVDLGRIDLPIDDATLLSDLNNGSGVTLDEDPDEPDITFVARDGTEYEVDLTGVTTVGQLRTAVSSETGGHITLSVTDGDKLTVTDTVGGGGNLKVTGAGLNGTRTAEDLGILNESGAAADSFDGSIIPNKIADAAATTVQDVVDRINNAVGNPGVVASIAPDSLRIRLEDTTGSLLSDLIVESTAGNPTAADDLGIETTGAGTIYDGARLIGGLDSVLTRSINGGTGLGGATTITIDDRGGLLTSTVNDLDTYETVGEMIDAINLEAVTQGVQVAVSINDNGNGLKAVDTSGGTNNLRITGDGAAALGLTADVAEDEVSGSNLQLEYVSESSTLSSLNYGRGIGTGTFRITDGLGASATVNIGGSEKTLYDVILEINSKGLAVKARVNDNGDGLLIEEDAAALGGSSPFVKIKIESTGGSAASDLNIIGEAADLNGGFIDGSYERVVDLDTSDSLATVAAKINDAGVPVNATVVNTGTGGTPYRLSIGSAISGSAGDLVIDSFGVDLGLERLSTGRDAKVFFGSENPEDGFLLTSATNSLDNVLDGVTIDLHAASETAVSLTIARDEQTIVDSVGQMVAAFNDVINRIGEYDFYDVETEQRGLLLGDPTVARIRSSMYRVATGRALDVDGSYQFLSQVGVSFGEGGVMTFDEAKFRDAYATDPEGVEAVIAAYEIGSGTSEEIAEGVTIDSSEITYTSLGFANLFDNMLDDLTDSVAGTTTLAKNAFDNQIELLNDRIETIDERLESRRAQLVREFTAMERALAQLQSQSGSLGSLASNINLASTQLSLGG